MRRSSVRRRVGVAIAMRWPIAAYWHGTLRLPRTPVTDVEDAATWGDLFRLVAHLRAELQRALDGKAAARAELGMFKATVREAQMRCGNEDCWCPAHTSIEV